MAREPNVGVGGGCSDRGCGTSETNAYITVAHKWHVRSD